MGTAGFISSTVHLRFLDEALSPKQLTAQQRRKIFGEVGNSKPGSHGLALKCSTGVLNSEFSYCEGFGFYRNCVRLSLRLMVLAPGA